MEDLRRLVRNPNVGIRELNRLFHTRGRTLNGNPDGTDLFEEDWDVCIILDACRYDYFEKYAKESLSGTLSRRESIASSTIEWINSCVVGNEYHETVYVTSNPKFYRSDASEDVFFDTIYSWERSDSGSNLADFVDPHLMEELTYEALEQYPNKRILSHFMQPHVPFLGQRGKDMFSGDPYDKASVTETGVSYTEAFRAAYRENLEYVIPYIERILESIDLRIVITADHGQLLGEWTRPIPIREFGHPSMIYAPELVTIPWLVREGSARRKIVAEDPVSSSRTDSETEREVDELLRVLGYK